MSQEEEREEPSALSDIIDANGGEIPELDELAARRRLEEAFALSVKSIDAVGDYKPEEDDPNVLIYGPWLERGGSAFWVSTAGTGKSIGSIQMAHAMSAGKPFCGLRPRGCLKFWIFQSEDSPRRVAQDRIDVRAELAEQYPDVDWEKVGEGVKIVKLTGKVGVAFLAELDHLLSDATELGQKPDVIILNPLLAFVGGPISDGSYVTPFLRGGMIDGRETVGLQAILERHAVGVLIFHHTPKPPTEKEIDAWMKSPFPEYQGAGSSDITNWGRSFVTMMRVKGHANMVCVTAGKNGGELGWERVGGACRRYMAYSDSIGVSGKGRHAWRDLTPEEYEEVVGTDRKDDERKELEAVDAVVDAIKRADVAPLVGVRAMEAFMSDAHINRNILRAAIAKVQNNAAEYRLTITSILHANNKWEKHIGQAENIRAAQQEQAQRRKIASMTKAAPTVEKPQNVEAVGPSVEPEPAPQSEENIQEEIEDANFPF